MKGINRREFVQICSAAGAAVAGGRLLARAQNPLAGPMKSLSDAIAVAEADPNRPAYHFRPPANWTNDPNGTIYYKDWHHLFYQLNPAAPRGGNQHWGHARSRDLVNWEHLPIALWPLTDRGERAIFSGGAVLGPDRRPRLLYTSIGHPSPEQWIAIPKDDDLIAWDRPAINPVLTVAAHGKTEVSQWRDPFMFHENGQTYMVCGGNLNNGRGGGGSVQLYRATRADLTQWKFLGVVFQYRDLQIWNVECPNLFRLGTKWVLLMSPQQPCEYFIGDLDIATCRFTPESHGILDAGTSYASNISVDNTGRTIQWLWGRTANAADKGWNGVMTLPRILSLNAAGFLRQQPAVEFEKLRGAAIVESAFDVPAGQPLVLSRIQGDCLEIKAEVVMNGASEVGFDLRRSADGRPGATVRINRATGSLIVGNIRTPAPRGAERYSLRLFLDKAVLEVFLNDGDVAVYTTLEAGPSDLGLAVVAQQAPARGGGPPAAGRGAGAPGGAPPNAGRSGVPLGNARIESLSAWPMKPAEFSLEHFHL
jgi:beta-fructofuranosidase